MQLAAGKFCIQQSVPPLVIHGPLSDTLIKLDTAGKYMAEDPYLKSE